MPGRAAASSPLCGMARALGCVHPPMSGGSWRPKTARSHGSRHGGPMVPGVPRRRCGPALASWPRAPRAGRSQRWIAFSCPTRSMASHGARRNRCWRRSRWTLSPRSMLPAVHPSSRCRPGVFVARCPCDYGPGSPSGSAQRLGGAGPQSGSTCGRTRRPSAPSFGLASRALGRSIGGRGGTSDRQARCSAAAAPGPTPLEDRP